MMAPFVRRPDVDDPMRDPWFVAILAVLVVIAVVAFVLVGVVR